MPQREVGSLPTSESQVRYMVSMRGLVLLVMVCRGCELGDVTSLPPLPASGPGPSPLPHIDQSNTLSLDSAPRLSDTNVVKTFLKEHEHNRYIPPPHPSPTLPLLSPPQWDH